MIGEAHRYVCIGLRETRDGKYANFYLDENGDERAWAKSQLGSVIGGVYEAQIAEGHPGRVYRDTAHYVGPSDDARIPEWRLLSRTASARQEAARAEKRARKTNGDIGDLTLREIRDTMRRQLPAQSAGMLSAAIGYLTGGQA